MQQLVIEGSIAGGGRTLRSVDRYSASWSDLVDRTLDAGVERFVFLGWFLPVLALAGLAILWRRDRPLAIWLGLAALIPIVLALGTTTSALRAALARVSAAPLSSRARAPDADRLPRARRARRVRRRPHPRGRRSSPWCSSRLPSIFACPLFASVEADEQNRAYAAIQTDGRLFELPVFRPDMHFGSVYLAYAMQSPRERPQGYSTVGPTEADRRGAAPPAALVRARRDPAAIEFVAVHRGLYRQSGYFARRLRRSRGGSAPPRGLAAARARRRPSPSTPGVSSPSPPGRARSATSARRRAGRSSRRRGTPREG